jgi:hypothetical protein
MFRREVGESAAAGKARFSTEFCCAPGHEFVEVPVDHFPAPRGRADGVYRRDGNVS